jgi:hypothetical protein
VPAARKFAVTDSSGAFSLAGLPTGVQGIRIFYEGRQSGEYPFTLRSGHTKKLAVLLDLDAANLDPLVVEAQQPDQWRDLAGFYARKQWYGGFARFFTREEIAQAQPPTISTLLLAEHIVTRCFERCLPTRFRWGRLCAVPISVDGMPFREEDYDRIAVEDVAGIEVYRGAPPLGLSHGLSLTPAYSVWQGDRGTCSTVLIWTR